MKGRLIRAHTTRSKRISCKSQVRELQSGRVKGALQLLTNRYGFTCCLGWSIYVYIYVYMPDAAAVLAAAAAGGEAQALGLTLTPPGHL